MRSSAADEALIEPPRPFTGKDWVSTSSGGNSLWARSWCVRTYYARLREIPFSILRGLCAAPGLLVYNNIVVACVVDATFKLTKINRLHLTITAHQP